MSLVTLVTGGISSYYLDSHNLCLVLIFTFSHISSLSISSEKKKLIELGVLRNALVSQRRKCLPFCRATKSSITLR